jgi:hypothetical protein
LILIFCHTETPAVPAVPVGAAVSALTPTPLTAFAPLTSFNPLQAGAAAANALLGAAALAAQANLVIDPNASAQQQLLMRQAMQQRLLQEQQVSILEGFKTFFVFCFFSKHMFESKTSAVISTEF